MTVRERAEELFAGGYNCGESVIMAVCPDCSHDAVKAMAAFGGGMASGKTCGALAGAIGALGIATIETRQKDSPNSRALIKEFLEIYKAKYNDSDCSNLKPKVAKPGINCREFVGDVAQMVSDFISEKI